MDTKLKSIKYSAWAKTAAFIVVWLGIMCAVGSVVFLLNFHETVNSKSYYDTHQFKNEFSTLVGDAVEYNVKLKSEANIKSSGDTEETINKKLQRYYQIKKKLSKSVNFAYYFKNTNTGETVTNIKAGAEDALALIQKQPSLVYYNQGTFDSNNLFSIDVMQMLEGAQYEIYAAVIEPLKPGDVFYDAFMSYSKNKALSNNATIILVLATILTIAAFIYLVMVTGRREPEGEINLSFIDRLYTDVYSMLVFLAAIISIAIAAQISYSSPVDIIIIALVFGIDMLIGLTYVLSMIRQIKSGQLIRNTLIYKIFAVCFSGKTFKKWTLLLLLGYGAINGVLFALALHSGGAGLLIFLFLIVPFNIAAVYFAAKALLSLSQIMEAAKEISVGNLDYALDNTKVAVAFASFAKDIQSIQGGLKKAVAEAIKGERMKTELITNVSHDLKTPLTSVINYVDLLKQEDLNNEKACQYLNILEEKSARLKQLIEDLIEASKASSGNLAVSVEKVDLHELVMQACGEYEEKFQKAELDVHITADKTFIAADGKHMWRIVENLLSNTVKYSLSRTRVYINVAKSESCGVLIVKNISSNPLDISPEQLTERFVRGDLARTTEGAGLGLSIAQSLTGIQGGRFKIETDGDLFKVTVEMPLWEEE